MTIADVIAQVDALKPNAVDEEKKIGWISDLDGKIWAETYLTHEMPEGAAYEPYVHKLTTEAPEDWGSAYRNYYTYADGGYVKVSGSSAPVWEAGEYYFPIDKTVTLLVPEPYSSLYRFFVEAQIDYTNGELPRYTNSMGMFNVYMKTFSSAWNRAHLPVQSVKAFYFGR